MGLVVCLVGDCLGRGPEPSFVLVLLVPSPEPFLSKSEGEGGGVLPFWTVVQTQLAGVHEKSEQWEGSVPTGGQWARPTGALHHLHGEGQGEERGGQEEEKDGGTGRTDAYRQFTSLNSELQIFSIYSIMSFSVSFLFPALPLLFLLCQIPAGVPTVADLLFAEKPPSLS